MNEEFDVVQPRCFNCHGLVPDDGSNFCCEECETTASLAADEAAENRVIEQGY